MSATVFPPRCKDKNNLAKTFSVSRIFCKNTSFFSISATSAGESIHLSFTFSCYTSAKVGKENEKWKKHDDHFFHFTKFDLAEKNILFLSFCCHYCNTV